MLPATDVQAPRVQSNAPVKGGLVGVESPEVSSSFTRVGFPGSADHRGMLRGEASIIINALQLTASSLCYAPASGSR